MAQETVTALEAVTPAIEGEIVNAPLSEEERVGHTERVRRIQENFQQIAQISLDMWRDLSWIKENRTYRERYDTFDEFCKNELGKDNSQIYRYMKDAKFKEQLLLEAGTDEERASILNLKESNTRFLRTLDEDTQVAFWKLAYTIGDRGALPKKEDGSMDFSTAFLESVGEKTEEALTQGGVHLDGQFITFDNVSIAAEHAGVDEDTAKEILIAAGVSEEYVERLERQKDHIREKSAKADIIPLKGTIETRQDVNGSDYPVIIDSKGNETDLNELMLSFNNRWVALSVKAPIRG
jgi:hypothetical protein